MSRVDRVSMNMHGFAFWLTMRCNAKCDFCLASSGPDAKGADMDMVDALRWVGELNRIPSIKEITFLGGEPFLRFDDMIKMVSLFNGKPRFATNGFWGKDPHQADRIARALARTGKIADVSLSTDKSHQKFIPIEYIKTCLDALVNVGIKTQILVVGDEDEWADVRDDIFDHCDARPHRKKVNLYIGRRGINPNGRGDDACDLKEFPISKFFYDEKPCFGYPSILANGDVIPCTCAPVDIAPGSPLILGNAKQETLAEILSRYEKSALAAVSRQQNRYKILFDALKTGGKSELLKSTYTHRCALCRDIFNTPEMSEAVLHNLESFISEKPEAVLPRHGGAAKMTVIERLQAAVDDGYLLHGSPNDMAELHPRAACGDTEKTVFATDHPGYAMWMAIYRVGEFRFNPGQRRNKISCDNHGVRMLLRGHDVFFALHGRGIIRGVHPGYVYIVEGQGFNDTIRPHEFCTDRSINFVEKVSVSQSDWIYPIIEPASLKEFYYMYTNDEIGFGDGQIKPFVLHTRNGAKILLKVKSTTPQDAIDLFRKRKGRVGLLDKVNMPLQNVQFVDDAHVDLKQRKLPFSVIGNEALKELLDAAYPIP